MRSLLIVVLIVALLLANSVSCVYGQMNALCSSTSVTFIKVFPVIRGERSLGGNGVSISVKVDSQLTYKENVILLTRASSKYAEEGKSAILQIDISNAVSSLRLNANFTISISYGVGKIDVPVKVMEAEFVLLEDIGKSREIAIGEYLLFSGTVPILGVQVSIFAKPVVKYTPILHGKLTINGSASASPSDIFWHQNQVTCKISFLKNEPISIFLSNPELVLNDLEVVLKIYAIITAATIEAPDLEIVNLGDYSVKSSDTVHLISFEPNYYDFYSRLQESYSTIVSTMQEFQRSLTSLFNRLDEFSGDLSTLTQDMKSLKSRVEELSTNISLASSQSLSSAAILLSIIAILISVTRCRSISKE